MGLSPAEKHRLEKLYRRRVPPRSILTQDLARELASLTHDLNRRIGMLVDRLGRVERVAVGDARRVAVPRQPSAPAGRQRFCTLRFIATRLDDDELGPDELAPLGLHRLDAIALIAVGGDGAPGPVRVAHLMPAPDRPERGLRAREGGAYSGPDGPGRPAQRGMILPRRRVRGRRSEIREVSSDGERYRLFPPRAASLVEDDFLELIRALEQEFDRHMERTKVAGKLGRAILIHVTTGSRAEAAASMTELAELAMSSDLQVIEQIVQRRERFDPRTLMGSGRLQELIIQATRQQVDFIVFDQDLSPAQARAIAQATDLKILDRSQLILDIFAARARTHEGKIQVELAQLKYLMPRLTSRGDSGLSRLEGGIGGRGPGEQKLEIDRRRVRDRIARLERLLLSERKRREQRRSRRRARDVPVVSLVGYTNAGKSTLLNLLTRSDVFVEHRMFATLDPTSRRLRLPREREIVVNDTVGFIRDLPADLLEAFRATLEEIEDSDLIVHLVDASHPGRASQVRAVEGILGELGYSGYPRLTVFNKLDLLSEPDAEDLLAANPHALGISALGNTRIDRLLERIDQALPGPAREPDERRLSV